MKVKTILTGLLMVLVCTGALFAQNEKEGIAVMPFFYNSVGIEGQTVANLFGGLMAQLYRERFSVYPRTNMTDSVYNEVNFQQTSGMTDAKTYAELGRQSGAKYVLSGSITAVGSQKVLIVTIIRIETMELIAGTYVLYTAEGDLQGKISSMLKDMVPMVDKDRSKLPRLAVASVKITNISSSSGKTDADALAQILSIELLHSNSYAVYPRTSNIEEVQKELATQQTSGITNEKEAARVGLGINPDSVLAVEAQSLGQNNIFIANIYGLRGGKLGALQEFAQQNYINLEDGMRAMILVARNISGQQVSNQDQEARQREIKAAANKAAFDAKKAAFAEKMEPFLRDSGIVFGGYGGLNLPGEVKDTQENAQISGFGGAEIGFFYNWFSINAGVQPNFGYHYSEMDTKTGATKMAVTYSFVQIPVTARADFFLNDITDKFGSFGIGFWAGPCINIAPWETKDNATVKIPSMGAIVGTEGTIGISNVIFCLGVQYALDLDSATVVFADKSSGEFTRKTWDMTFRVRIKVPFRKSSSFARGAVRVE